MKGAMPLLSLLPLLVGPCSASTVEREGIEFSFNGLIGRFQDQTHVKTAELTKGLAVAVWERVDDLEKPQAVSVQGRLVNGEGRRSGVQFQVNLESLGGRRAYPEVAGLSDGRFMVVWQCGASKACARTFKVEQNLFGPYVEGAGAQMLVTREEDEAEGKAVGNIKMVALREAGQILVQYQLRKGKHSPMYTVMRVLRASGEEVAMSEEVMTDGWRKFFLAAPQEGHHFLMAQGKQVYAGYVHRGNATVSVQPLATIAWAGDEEDHWWSNGEITGLAMHSKDTFLVTNGYHTYRHQSIATLLTSEGEVLGTVPLGVGARSVSMRALDGFQGTVVTFSLEADDIQDEVYDAFDVYCMVLKGPELQKAQLEGKVNTYNRKWLGGLTLDHGAPFIFFPEQGVQDFPAVITLSREEGRQFLILWQSDSLEGLTTGEIGLSGQRFAFRD